MTLKVAFKSIFEEINKIIKDGFIEVKGQKLPTELFLGGIISSF